MARFSIRAIEANKCSMSLTGHSRRDEVYRCATPDILARLLGQWLSERPALPFAHTSRGRKLSVSLAMSLPKLTGEHRQAGYAATGAD